MTDNLYRIDAELADAAAQLLQPTELMTVASILADRASVPDLPGIYGWWFRAALPDVPLEGTLTRDDYRLLYVGIAPRAPSASGSESKSTLRRRIVRNHLGRRLARSTLRRSLAVLLRDHLDLDISRNAVGKAVMPRPHEQRLTDWLAANAALTLLVTPQPWELETALIGQGPTLPLNLAGSSHPFRATLSELRRSHRAGYRGDANPPANAIP